MIPVSCPLTQLYTFIARPQPVIVDSPTVDRRGRRGGFAFLHRMLQCLTMARPALSKFLIDTELFVFQIGKSEEPHSILRFGPQHAPRTVSQRLPKLVGCRYVDASLLGR
jgi:hypothetical protein